MIRANEIRIGNYVFMPFTKEIVKINGIALKEVTYIQAIFDESQYFALPEQFQPIPLTEEWLLKFGFKYDYDLVNSLVLCGIWFNKKNMEATYLSQKLIKLKHVHQLQNLFFALTGEELTLKP